MWSIAGELFRPEGLVAKLHDGGAEDGQDNDNGEAGCAFSGFLLTLIFTSLLLPILLLPRAGKNAASHPTAQNKVVDAALLAILIILAPDSLSVLLAATPRRITALLAVILLLFIGVLLGAEQHDACFIVHFSDPNIHESQSEEGHPGLHRAGACLPG